MHIKRTVMEAVLLQNKQFSLQNKTVALYKNKSNKTKTAAALWKPDTVSCQEGLLMKQQLLELK